MLLRCSICVWIAVFTLNAQGGGRGYGGPAGGLRQQFGPPPPPPASDCAVSGTVVNAMTGEPIPRAMVTLGGADGAGSATDATGHWSISNTTCAANRRATASRIGFIASQMAQATSGSRPTVVNLVSGSPVTGVKISLMPESSITGKVQDPNGDPIGSARIQALRVTVQAGERMLVNAASIPTTDSQGNFRIGRLPPGRYVVCVGSPELTYPVGGGAAMVYPDTCFPGPATSGISIAMPVEAGREVHTSFTLTPAPGVHVRGRVSGVPPTALRSNVQLIKLPRNLSMGQSPNATVQDDGSFDIRTVLPGSYVATLNLQPNPGQPPTIMQTPVEVGSADVDNVSLTLQPAGSLSGTVSYQLSNPATPANPPVAVNLRPSSSASFFGAIPQAQWDANHLSFDFANIQSGAELRLNVNVNGRDVYVRSATLRGQDILYQPFTLQGTAGPVDIVVSDDTGSIDVTVNDKDGHPAPDASVILVSTSGLRRILTSGDEGHATQKTLPTGDYRAWAFDNIATVPYAEEEWMNQNAGSGEKVTIASGGSATVTIKRLAAPPE
jgi:hypothetical protein